MVHSESVLRSRQPSGSPVSVSVAQKAQTPSFITVPKSPDRCHFSGTPSSEKGFFKKLLDILKGWLNKFLNLFKKEIKQSSEETSKHSINEAFQADKALNKAEQQEQSSGNTEASGQNDSRKLENWLATRRAEQLGKLQTLPELTENFIQAQKDFNAIFKDGSNPDWGVCEQKARKTRIYLHTLLGWVAIESRIFIRGLESKHHLTPEQKEHLEQYKKLESTISALRGEIDDFASLEHAIEENSSAFQAGAGALIQSVEKVLGLIEDAKKTKVGPLQNS